MPPSGQPGLLASPLAFLNFFSPPGWKINIWMMVGGGGWGGLGALGVPGKPLHRWAASPLLFTYQSGFIWRSPRPDLF